jgi:hypothetical protein
MVFEPQTLAPGFGIGVQAMAIFRWRSFQSALSGQGYFMPPPLVEIMTLQGNNRRNQFRLEDILMRDPSSSTKGKLD